MWIDRRFVLFIKWELDYIYLGVVERNLRGYVYGSFWKGGLGGFGREGGRFGVSIFFLNF